MFQDKTVHSLWEVFIVEVWAHGFQGLISSLYVQGLQ